MPSQLLIRKIW